MMKEIMIRDVEGKQINVNVVRYFRLNSMEYLIFSLNEVDEGGYVKLYVSKIINNIGQTISDDVEWNLIKDTIKTVIKSNKDNLPLPIIDLDVNVINNIQILDQKIFKLNDSLLQLLTANKKEEIIVNQNVVTQPQAEIPQVQTIVNPEPTILTNNNADGFNAFETSVDTNINATPSQVPFMENPIVTPEVNNVSDYALDYKTLYENELNKNQELKNELEKYKALIDNLKNILNQQI